MSAKAGRDMTISIGGAVIAGCRTKSVSISRTPIDVTDDDDNGVRKLLAEAGQVDIDISVDGITKSNVLRNAAKAPDSALSAVIVTFGGAGTMTGNCFITSYEESGSYQDAVTFSASLSFAGAVT